MRERVMAGLTMMLHRSRLVRKAYLQATSMRARRIVDGLHILIPKHGNLDERMVVDGKYDPDMLLKHVSSLRLSPG